MAIPITPPKEQINFTPFNPIDIEHCSKKRIYHIQRVVHYGLMTGPEYGEGTVWDIWACAGCKYLCMSTPGNVICAPGWKTVAENMTPLKVQHPTRRKRLHGLQMELRHKQEELGELKAKIAAERAL